MAVTPVLCGYKAMSHCDDGADFHADGSLMIHVARSADIKPEFDFQMRMMARSGGIPSRSEWSMTWYLPRGEQREF